MHVRNLVYHRFTHVFLIQTPLSIFTAASEGRYLLDGEGSVDPGASAVYAQGITGVCQLAVAEVTVRGRG